MPFQFTDDVAYADKRTGATLTERHLAGIASGAEKYIQDTMAQPGAPERLLATFYHLVYELYILAALDLAAGTTRIEDVATIKDAIKARAARVEEDPKPLDSAPTLH